MRSVTERIDESPSGKFIETVIAAAAQLDNDVRADRTVAGMKEAASRGRFVWKAPLGFRNSKDRSGPSLEIDPERGPLVRRAFDVYDSGRDRSAVLTELNVLGLKSQQGRALSVQSLHNLLKNPVYIGLIAFAEHVMSNASALWTGASPKDRRTLQAVLFPAGLSYGPNGLGTTPTSSAFSCLREVSIASNGMASPPGTEH